jgi:hypothetical protein
VAAQKICFVICGLLALLLTGCTSTPIPPTATPTMPSTASPTFTPTPQPRQTVWLAHYMPWYQTPEMGGSWGWHWTMNHFSPDKMDANGRREIAAYNYPFTGPYDSRDEALLEYQVALMKLSGIDGVIVDWYGNENYLDYGLLNDSTVKLFEVIKKAGLKFAICYEDQTVKRMVEQGHLDDGDVYTYAQGVMSYLETTWFNDDAYLKINGQPVLFIFGPQYFTNAADWDTIFSALTPRPAFITLDYQVAAAANGGYPWPPMSAAQNGTLSQTALENYLTKFYAKTAQAKIIAASAFPGFHDIYKEAGVSEGYGTLDSKNGETFKFTLQTALASNPDVIQLVTWNDYGEGTTIEPAEPYGYRYLEIVQETRRSFNPGFPFQANDLPLPLQWFRLQQQYKDDAKIHAQLDEAFQAIITGDLAVARNVLETIRAKP